jgi:serine O-acetyltransferase
MKVRCSLAPAELAKYVRGQINAIFPDAMLADDDALMAVMPAALARLEHCFTHISNKYFFDGESAVFDHLHGDQYAMWLYILSNTLYRAGGRPDLCKKLFLLNKMLHGCDIFYEVELPPVFLLVHPLGTVLGRGTYGNFLMVYQRCGVGSNHDIYPRLGDFLTMRPGSAVLGKATVGANCTIAAESLLLDKDLPADSVYIGNPRDPLIRPNTTKDPIWRT